MADAITYSIAGHLLQVVGDGECALLRQMPGFPVFVTDAADPEWHVVFGHDIPQPKDWTILYQFQPAVGALASTLARVGETFYFYMTPSHPQGFPLLMRYQLGSAVVEATACNDPVVLRFALWTALGMLSSASKMVLIHASCVVHQGKAVLCLGESGTGKSTHTRLWLKHIPDCFLLNDDSPVLAFENGASVVYGSPWSGKTHHYHQLRFPLAAAVRLSQASCNQIRPLGTIEAFSALLPSFPPALAQDERLLDRMVAMLSEMLPVTPVFHLDCLPDEAAAWTSHDAIFGRAN